MSDRRNRFDPLEEGNYAVWEKFIKALLVKKGPGIWDIVSGATPCPQGSPNSTAVKSWRRKADEAIAEITLNVAPSQLSFINSDDPAIVWAELERIHNARGVASRLTLRRKFWKLQKASDQSMQSFIGEVRTVYLQLKNIGVEIDDEEMILVLTGGLPSSYDQLVVSLDSTTPSLLTVNYVVTRLLNEESRQLNSDSMEPLENAATAQDQRRRRPLSKITCYKCGKLGHYQSNCPDNNSTAATTATVDSDSDIFDA